MPHDTQGGWGDTLAGLLAPHGGPVHAATSYTPGDYSVHFFLQLAIILLVCRLVEWVANRFLGQPQVVGEMIAGVVLGLSLLGLLLPHAQLAIFPKATRDVLYAGAQLGVGLYMFVVGLTLRFDLFASKAWRAGAVGRGDCRAMLATPPLLGMDGLFAPGIGKRDATLSCGPASR